METWITPSLIVSLLALGIGALNSYYVRKRDTKGDWQKLIDELRKEIDDIQRERTEATEKRTENEASLKVLKMQMELFWKTVEQQMAKKFRDE